MRNKHVYTFLAGLLVAPLLAAPKYNTTKKKYSYGIGRNFIENVKRQDVDLDHQAFLNGIRDALKGKKSALTDAEIAAAFEEMGKLRAEASKNAALAARKDGETFLEKNAKKKGIETSGTGLQYQFIKRGTGRIPSQHDQVIVHYRGTFINGKEFDSSYKRGKPATFGVSQVISAWTEALQMMPVGSKVKLFVPSELAYGERRTGAIPANSVLLFEIELLGIK